tara:strand:+ start:1717 stop:2406 length:690 start_codon:yes stop_codon:yes gene_type:complete
MAVGYSGSFSLFTLTKTNLIKPNKVNESVELLDEIKRLAIKELLNPSLELSIQFLSSLHLEAENGIPIIKRIDFDDPDGIIVVYVPIKDELFYFALYFDSNEKNELVDIGTEAGSKVYLWVYDSEKIDKSGFPYQPINVGNKSFTYSLDNGDPDNLEDKINLLLERLESRIDDFLKFSQQTHMSINVAYYGYKEQMWGLHLDKNTIRRLNDLNIDLDFDIYASGSDLKD